MFAPLCMHPTDISEWTLREDPLLVLCPMPRRVCATLLVGNHQHHQSCTGQQCQPHRLPALSSLGGSCNSGRRRLGPRDDRCCLSLKRPQLTQLQQVGAGQAMTLCGVPMRTAGCAAKLHPAALPSGLFQAQGDCPGASCNSLLSSANLFFSPPQSIAACNSAAFVSLSAVEASMPMS